MDDERRQRERRALSDPQDAAARVSREQARLRRGSARELSGLNVTDLCFSPDGAELLVATRGAIERRTEDGILIETWPAPRGFKNEPRSIAVAPDGSVIAVSSWGDPLTLLDREGRPLLVSITPRPDSRAHSDPVHALSFESPESLLVLSNDGAALRVEVASGRARPIGLFAHRSIPYFSDACLAPRRQLIFAMGPMGAGWPSSPLLRQGWRENAPVEASIPCAERPDPRDLSAWTHRSPILCAALSPDENALAIGNKLCRTALILLDDAGRPREARPFDLVGQSDPARMKDGAGSIALAFHPEGRAVVAVNAAGDLVRYEVQSGRALSRIRACFFPGRPDRALASIKRAGFSASVEALDGRPVVAGRASFGPAVPLLSEDIVLAVNGEEVLSLGALVAAFEAAPRLSEVSVERGGQRRSIEVDLEAWRDPP